MFSGGGIRSASFNLGILRGKDEGDGTRDDGLPELLAFSDTDRDDDYYDDDDDDAD